MESMTAECACCGAGLTATTDRAHGTGIHDEGFGECRECYGDPTAKGEKKRMGWASVMFFDARIPVLLGSLSADNATKFRAMPYAKKCAIIGRLIERGMMV